MCLRFWLFTLSMAYCIVSYLFTQIFAALNFVLVWRPSHDSIRDNSNEEGEMAAALPRYRETKKEEAFLSERLFGVLFRKILGET